jgi:uncharacterized protein
MANFTDGDLVVYRVGDGTGSLGNTGNSVFLDEYTPTGTLKQSIALPTTVSGANKQLIASGTASSEGLLTRSSDGRYLFLTGYGSNLGGSAISGTTGAVVPRTVGRVDASGTIDTSTALTDFATGNNPRSVVSTNGTDIWLTGGAGGVRYISGLGGTTSTDLTSSTLGNVRQINVFNNQLYASSGSGTNTFRGVETIGTGLPTSGSQTVTRLPGLTDTTNPSTYGFFLADLTPTVAGADTLYVADDGAGALTKFSLVGGNWVSNGTVGVDADDYRGLTGSVTSNTVTLFATRKGGSNATGGGELVSLVDSTGYNVAFSGTPTLLATAANNTAFRGVAFAPVNSAPVTQPDLTVSLADTPDPVIVANPLTYTLSVGNSGTVNATGVSLQYTLPGGVTFNNTTVANGFTASQSGSVVTFSGGSINAGSSANLTVNVTPTTTGTLTTGTAIVDPGNAIAESNENNNTAAAITTTVNAAPPTTGTTRIHDIQGAAHTSPLRSQTVSNVPGIVTVVRSNGFYLQDPNPDTNDATSEGIFVFTSSAPTVAVGDSIQVSGTVSEFRPGGTGGTNNLTTTQIGSPTITKLSSGNILPTATVIGNGGRAIPNQIISNDAASGNVENTGTVFDPAQDGIDFYESLEGMRVQVNNAVAVGPTNSFGEIPVLADNGANGGTRTARGGIVIQPGDFNPERIFIDDTLIDNPPLVNVGDKFNEAIVGVMDYSFSNFKLYNTQALPSVTSAGLQREVTNLTPTANQLTVATFNVENLDAAEAATKFNNLASRIVTNLKAPDIISLEEIQDNNGATNDSVVDATTTYQTLINAIVAAGGPTYQFRQIDPVDDQDGGEPGGNIRVGFLFNPNRVQFVDRAGGTSTSNTTVTNVNGVPQISASPGRIDPTNPAFNTSRKPLVGEFTFNGQTVYVVSNHFNSKGGDQPLFGLNQPPTLTSETQRNQQATILKNFVQSILAINPSANVVVAGDLNDFEFSNPLTTLESAGLNTLVETLPQNERYTYNFEGNAQTLDHILVSNNLLSKLDGYDVVHINSEFADQDSDHDPSVARFNFGTPDLTISQTDSPDPVVVGSALTYTLNVGNSGIANATGVAVQYTLPTGVTFNSTTVANGFTASQSGNVITFSGGSINANSSASLAVRVTPNTAGILTSGIAVADPANAIAESNETNNAAATISTNVIGMTTALTSSADNVFTISGGSGKPKLAISLTGKSSTSVNELGVFAVDDAQGKINGIAPGAAGYTEAALARSQVVLSALANAPNGFTLEPSRSLEFNNGDRLRFYLVKNSTTDAVRAGQTPLSNVVFSSATSQKVTDLGSSNFTLALEDGTGAADFQDLVVKIQPSNQPLPLGVSLQGKSQAEVIDLRGVTQQVKADFVLNREAGFNNLVGFYKVADESGGIDTNGDGKADLTPGQAGYIQAAVRGRVAGIDLAVSNQGTANFTDKQLTGGSIFAPFLISNGTVDQVLNGQNNQVYFAYLGANSDKVDHIRLLGNNTFGFEDLPAGGDFDYNDVTVRVNLSIA